MKNIDNIVIGNLIEGVTLEMLGVTPSETTVHMTEQQAADLNFFLPKILVDVGLFDSTSKVKQTHQVRIKSDKIKCPDEKNLWRNLDRPEMTRFKVGKKLFWLIVGDITPNS